MKETTEQPLVELVASLSPELQAQARNYVTHLLTQHESHPDAPMPPTKPVAIAARAHSPAEHTAFWASFGAWQASPGEPTLETLVAERRSKTEPPAL